MDQKSREPLYIFADDFYEHHNVAWRVEPGQLEKKNPLLTGKYPWDGATPFYNGTVLKDPVDGLWKLWGITYPVFSGHKWGEWDGRLGYAVSEDGIRWVRPMLKNFPCLGYKKSNVLLDLPDGGNCFQMSVLVTPKAKPGRRYEMFILRNPQYKNPSKRVKGLKNKNHPDHTWGLYRYFSPDGIHWNAAAGPLQIESADSLFVYKDIGAPYVAYHKLGPDTPPGSAYAPHDCGAGTVRILVRRESRDGTHWSNPPLPVMVPDWRDSHDTQFMDLGPLRQGSGYVATIAVFHALNQQMDIQFAGSPDGKRWFRPIPRVPCLANGPLGECGGGHIFQSHRLIEDGEKLHLYYSGAEGLHGDLYTETGRQQSQGTGQETSYPTAGLCRASWDKGRLWAAVPSAAGPSEARLTTKLLDAGGKNLYLNGVTSGDGEISAALYRLRDAYVLEEALVPIPGFSRKECRPFRGDSQSTVIAWKGKDRCPVEKVCVRFFFRKARLYGFAFA